LYPIFYIQKEKNMAKTLKLILAIILFAFLFFITEEVDCRMYAFEVIPTSMECISPLDCPDILVEPMWRVSICLDGFCANAYLLAKE
jgi:hypothetical protein